MIKHDRVKRFEIKLVAKFSLRLFPQAYYFQHTHLVAAGLARPHYIPLDFHNDFRITHAGRIFHVIDGPLSCPAFGMNPCINDEANGTK